MQFHSCLIRRSGGGPLFLMLGSDRIKNYKIGIGSAKIEKIVIGPSLIYILIPLHFIPNVTCTFLFIYSIWFLTCNYDTLVTVLPQVQPARPTRNLLLRVNVCMWVCACVCLCSFVLTMPAARLTVCPGMFMYLLLLVLSQCLFALYFLFPQSIVI